MPSGHLDVEATNDRMAREYAIDDYDGGRLYQEIVRLLREGQAAGIHVIATSERLLLGGRLAAHNDRRILLRQSDPSDFALIGISRDAVDKQRQFSDLHNFDFTLLSDPDGAVAERFGVRRRLALGPLGTRRMTFVIDTDRRILAVVHSEVSMNDHADRALQVLRERQA